MRHVDLFVIGGGPGGYEAALECAAMGHSAALAEEDLVGGTCLNRGCIPTKALLRAARAYALAAREAGPLGIRVQSAEASLPEMLEHAFAVEDQLREGILSQLKRAGVEIIPAHAAVSAPGRVTAGEEEWSADHILLATGSRPAPMPVPGSELEGVFSSDGFLLGKGVDCERLAIVGGGVIGAEFAQIYSDLGRQVTILEAMPRLLPRMDRELGQGLASSFRKRGIDVHLSTRLSRIERDGEGLVLSAEEKGQPVLVHADSVLVSVGRRPNTAGLLPPEMEGILNRGFIPVSSAGETAIPGLWAVGDVTEGSMQLAHTASWEGRRAVRAMFGEDAGALMQVPLCVFTEPEIASVGLTQEEAKAKGLAVETQKNLTSANGKSLVEGMDRGFARLVFDAGSGKLVGAQLMCAHASEMVGALGALIESGADRNALRHVIWPHPTVSEILSIR